MFKHVCFFYAIIDEVFIYYIVVFIVKTVVHLCLDALCFKFLDYQVFQASIALLLLSLDFLYIIKLKKIELDKKYLACTACYESFNCRYIVTSWYLFVQSQQWKHQNNMRNLFKVNRKDTRTTSLTLFWCLYC